MVKWSTKGLRIQNNFSVNTFFMNVGWGVGKKITGFLQEIPQAESNWRLNELTDGAVMIQVGSLFWNVKTRIEFPTWNLQHFLKMTLQAWPHWGNKKEAGVRIQCSRKHIICSYEVSMECRPSRRSCSLYGPRGKPLWAHRWLCSEQSALAPRVGDQACIAFSRWGTLSVLPVLFTQAKLLKFW